MISFLVFFHMVSTSVKIDELGCDLRGSDTTGQ